MELRQLVYFEAVVRCGGFTRAAESPRIAQPAISVQVQRLEAELGTVLLIRTTRRVALTAAGEKFPARARRVLGELDAARGEIAQLAALLRGHVTLGATPVLGSLDLPRALAGFHTQYPGVTLALRTGLIGELLTALDSGELDLVLGPVHPDLDSRYTSAVLAEEQLVLVTAPGHSLSQADPVTFTQMRDETFICLPPGSGLRALLTAAAGAENVQPRVQFEAATPASIRELVAAGSASPSSPAPPPPPPDHRSPSWSSPTHQSTHPSGSSTAATAPSPPPPTPADATSPTPRTRPDWEPRRDAQRGPSLWQRLGLAPGCL